MILKNPSFPAGKWEVEYIRNIDRWRIRTEGGDFIADVGPTLVAYWIVAVYNAITLREIS
jgi:hypothetical protein